MGGIDLYARDAQGRFVVVELKRGRAGHEAVHQLSRYVEQVRTQVPGEVRGILAAPAATARSAVPVTSAARRTRREHQTAFNLVLALIASLGIFGGLIMPSVVNRRGLMTVMVLVLGALLLGGYFGLLLAPASAPWLWALMLGISGWSFPGAIAMITARTRNPRITAQVSGFVQPIGYVIAGATLVTGAEMGLGTESAEAVVP